MSQVCVECKGKYNNIKECTRVEDSEQYICDICKIALSIMIESCQYKYCLYTGNNEKKICCYKIYKSQNMKFCFKREKTSNSPSYTLHNICQNCLIDELIEEKTLSCDCEVCQEVIRTCYICPK